MPRILDAFFLGMRNNLIYFVNIVLGFIWVCITRKVTLAEKTALIILFVFTTCGIYIGGKSQAYTPLILGVFVPLGVIAEIDYIELCQSIKRAAQKHQHHKRGNLILRSRIKTICALCVTISLIIFTYFSSYNTYFFCAGKDVMPQFEFAKSMYKLEDNPSLLNYGFMDEGFFTAANIIPNIKFFCTLNILTAEIKDEQNNYLYAGATSFVVTKDSQLDTINFNKYELIANKAFYSKSYHSTFYLYHRCCDD